MIVFLGSVVFLFALILYLPVLHAPFLFDDHAILDSMPPEYLEMNTPYFHPLILLARELPSRSLQHVFRSRCLTQFTYHLNAYHYGLFPEGWHITSARIHALSTLTLYFILLHFFSLPVSFLSALTFAAHPLNTMAVAYIAGRSSSLCALFILMTILFLLAHHPLLAVLPAVAAIRSKEESLTLIPVMLSLCFI